MAGMAVVARLKYLYDWVVGGPETVCERHGHDYGPFMRSHPVCKRCGAVDPPPLCWHCGKGHFTDIEPIMGTPCCDYCGRDVVSTPGSLPGYDNAGTISGTERKAGLGEDAAA